VPLGIQLRDLEVRIPLPPDGRLIDLALPLPHAAVPRQRLQAGMTGERALDKRVKGLPTHLGGAGVESLEGIEHLEVVVEAIPEGLGQGGRLPREEEDQALPFLRPRVHEDANGERQGADERQGDREPPAVPDRSGFGEPAQEQRGDDEDAERVPHPPRPPTDGEHRPWDLATDHQGRDADRGVDQAADRPP
jgi:hypothetical protein